MSVLLAWRQVNYHQILTGKMKTALRRFEIVRLTARVVTRLTRMFKFGIFEFRLACYQWGNSWCLYSFYLIGYRLSMRRMIVNRSAARVS